MQAIELKEVYHGKIVLLEDEQVQEGKIVKPMLIGGVATQGNIGNENKRYYKTSLWKRECTRLQEAVKNGKFIGELDHPNDGKSRLEKTSTKYTMIEMDGNLMNFQARVLETPAGNTLKALLRGGVSVDISTRGFGTTEKEVIDKQEWEVVQDDYELIAIDQVAGHSNLSAEIQYYQENIKGGNAMDLEQLKKEHPDLVAEIENQTEERVKEDLTKSITKEVEERLSKEFEDKILDEIAKSRDEIVAEVTNEVKENLVPQYEEYQNMLGEIAEIVHDFVSEDGGDSANKDEAAVETENKLKESEKKVDQMRKELDEAKKTIAGFDVKDYLDEKLANEPFKKILKERLSTCSSREEVDKRFDEEKSFVTKVIQENETPRGSGEIEDTDVTDKDQNEKKTGEEQKQQRLAGVS